MLKEKGNSWDSNGWGPFFFRLKRLSMPKVAILLIGFILIVAFAHDLIIGIYNENYTTNDDTEDVINDMDKDYNLGVLVVAHGMPGQWNERVKVWFNEEVFLPVPAELGFLEYSPEQTIESAIKELEDKGVNRIIAIPLFICGNSSHTPEVYEALEDAAGGEVEVLCTRAMDDNPLVAEILLKHGLKLCKGNPYDPRDTDIKPEDASLIFYGHGDAEEWHQNWVAIADSLKSQIEENYTFHFKEVTYCFMGEGNLKSAVEGASGHPLVVPWMIARSSYSEINIRKEVGTYILTGQCKYDGQYLIDHPNAAEWVENRFYNYENNIVWSNQINQSDLQITVKDATIKNYNMTICEGSGEKEFIRTLDGAKVCSPPSVAETFQKMAKEIVYIPYRGVKLTEKGKRIVDKNYSKTEHTQKPSIMHGCTARYGKNRVQETWAGNL
ncbi:MAG: hypothetical protein DRN35_04715 [Thermoplasmata archaeon]|nr:MAG: hypothetical protein DRN35_04715 [Thermoplasmata archaeon]